MLSTHWLKWLFCPTRIRHRHSGTRRAGALKRSMVVAAELLEGRLLLTDITQVTSFSGTFLVSDPSVSDGKIAYMADPPGIAATGNVFVHDLQTGVTTNITGFTGNFSSIARTPSISNGIVA